MVKTILCLSIFLLVAGAASADSGTWVYTYTGNELNGCTCQVDGSFTTAALIPASSTGPTDLLSYSFTVDGFTFNSADSTGSIQATTNASGGILSWTISIADGDKNLFSSFTGSTNDQNIPYYAIDVYGFGADEDYRENAPGSWTVADPPTTPMPEPAPLVLLAVGALALLTARKALLPNKI
jgi:hypothetical protein